MHGPFPQTPRPLAGLQALTSASAGREDSAAQERRDDGLVEVLRALWRRRSVVVGVSVLALLLAAIASQAMTPQFRAAASIMLEVRQTSVIEMRDVLSGLDGDGATLASEMQVMTSRSLLEIVVRRESLLLDPAFNPALAPQGSLLQRLGLLPREPPEAPSLARQRASAVDALLARLAVRPLGRSRAVEIAVTAADPRKAARLANAVAQAYLDEQLAVKRSATVQAAQWLEEQVSDLRSRVEAAERAVENYRREAGLIEGRDSGLTAQQISELNSELIAVRARRAEAEAGLSQVERRLTAGGVTSAAELLGSELVSALRQEESAVRRRKAELATEYGPLHPRMRNVEAELTDLRANIDGEVHKIVQQLRNEVEVTRSREIALREAIREQQSEAGGQNQAQVRLRELEREAEAERALFSTFLARLKETSVQQGLQKPDARLLSRAEPPRRPNSPNLPVILGLALFAALPAGVGLALLLERLDRGIANLQELESVTGLRTLSLLPRVEPALLGGGTPLDYLLKRSASNLAESLRSLHDGLAILDVDRPPRVVMITSAQPREGKTTTATGLARVLARSGMRVLLIEADLRHPGLAAKLGLAPGPGLAGMLVENAALESALRRDRVNGLHLLPAGSAPGAVDLLDGSRMRTLLQSCAAVYDLVIVDAPPVLPVSDARRLARLADKTVFIVHWRHTARDSVALAVRQLRDAGADLAGAVLSQVDRRRHKHFGSGEEAAYTAPARRYYVD